MYYGASSKGVQAPVAVYALSEIQEVCGSLYGNLRPRNRPSEGS